MNIELQYLSALANVGAHGVFREGRNGGTYSMFGHQMRHDMRQGFPLLTTKRVHFRSIIVELLWFLKGDTNVGYLHEHGVKIWDEWADDNGNLGPVYGSQWRSWPAPDGRRIDQLANVLDSIRTKPYSRRHIVSAWNPAEIEDMALPPCHMMFQFYVSPGRHKSGDDEHDVLFLDLQLYQRSGDMFLGVPFNIASYALLLELVAREAHMVPRFFVHTFGDYHLYANHVEQAQEQLSREPRSLPKLVVREGAGGLLHLVPGDIYVSEYTPHPTIKAEVSK